MKRFYRCLAVISILGYSSTALSATNPSYIIDEGTDVNGTNVNLNSNNVYINSISKDGLSLSLTDNFGNVIYWNVRDGFKFVDLLPGDTYVSYNGGSADLSAIYGTQYGGSSDTFVWTKVDGTLRVDNLSGGDYVGLYAMSSDGSTAVGYGTYDNLGDIEAIRWTKAGGTEALGNIAGGSNAQAKLVSSDGNAVAGDGSDANGHNEAWHWTEASGLQALGLNAGGSFSTAEFMSDDGKVVVGHADNAAGHNTTFRWEDSTGFVGLGTIGNYDTNIPNFISTNGDVIVGDLSHSQFYYDHQAFRWTERTGMVGLGFLTDDYGTVDFSIATKVSKDGSVIAGRSGRTADGMNSYDDVGEAFRWTDATGITALGILSGDTYSRPDLMSDNGSVIVGTSGNKGAGTYQAFRWTEATGEEAIGNISMPVISNDQHAMGVSGNGSTIFGYITNPVTFQNIAAVWRLDGTVTDLGLLHTDDQYISANFSSADGSVIAGTSSDHDYNNQAFRWTSSGGLEGLGYLPGGNSSGAVGISGDGNMIAGSSNTASSLSEAFRWTESGGMEGLGFLTGGDTSAASAISYDGTTVVGEANDVDGNTAAFRWAQSSGVMESLGFLSTINKDSHATNVSLDGSVIAGTSRDDSNFSQAFRWTQSDGMVGLGYLATGSSSTYSTVSGMTPNGQYIIGDSYNGTGPEAYRWDAVNGMVGLGTIFSNANSHAKFISDDGSVVSGQAENHLYSQEAFRWTEDDGRVYLGMLAGDYMSDVTGMSSDGSVIIGSSTDGSTNRAFRWTQGTGLVALGNLTIDYQSKFSAAHAMNSDGSAIVGNIDDGSANGAAFRWTEATGTKTVKSLLEEKGLDVSNWALYDASSVSQDGKLIIGNGHDDNNGDTFYIANLGTVGIITPQELSQSLAATAATTSQISGSTVQQINITMFSAHNLAHNSTPLVSGNLGSLKPGSGENEDDILNKPVSNLSFFMSGTVGAGQDNDFDNSSINGIVGISGQVTQDLNIGFGLIGSDSHINLDLDGESSAKTKGFALLSSYEPNSGFRWYNTLFVVDMNVDIRRGYVNGLALDSSNGKTGGTAIGIASQIGWAFDISPRSTIMPYMELDVSQTKLHSYDEHGGPFPASFTGQEINSVTSRIGVEDKYKLKQNLDVNARIAWGHRYDDGKSGLVASSSGFTQSVGGDAGDKNWIDGAIGADWQATNKTSFNSELSGRTGDTAEPAVNLTVGSSYRF